MDLAIRSSPLARRGRAEEGEGADLFVALKQNDSPSLVSGCKIIACRVEFDGRDNIGCTQRLSSERCFEGRMEGKGPTFCDVLDLSLVSETLSKSPAARGVWIHGLSQGEGSMEIQKEGAGLAWGREAWKQIPRVR